MRKILYYMKGTQTDLARELGLVPSAVHRMGQTGVIPAAHCRKIEYLTGGKVTAEEMRPDIFLPYRESA